MDEYGRDLGEGKDPFLKSGPIFSCTEYKFVNQICGDGAAFSRPVLE